MLYSIDSTTGVATAIGSTGQKLRGLAISSTGRAYASRAAIDNPSVKGLWEVDLSTGAATFIGGTRGMSDMAFDAGGTLYGMENRRDSGCNRRFYSINTTTGAETFLAQSTIGCSGDLGGFAYSVTDDTFYWSPRFTLRSIDPVTAIDTFIANIGGDGIDWQVNLAASVTGQLFVVDRKSIGELYTIDKSTGQATRIGSTGVFVYSIAMVPDPDPDDDGILAVDDNCPFAANPNQDDGDGDGIGDVCDTCPTIPNPDQDETAACIAVTPADPTCSEAVIVLFSSEPVNGKVTVQQITTFSPVSFTKPDLSADVDVIDTNLRIARDDFGAVFNQGSDSTSWAVGTCAAPTSVFYSSHSTMIRNHFRPVDTNLPGSDTCLRNNTTGVEYDVRWTSWSCCGAGGFAYTRTQAPVVVPVVTVAYTDSMLPAEIDISTLADGDYELCVSATPSLPATIDSITFEIINTCGGGYAGNGTYEFFLNGVSLGTRQGGYHCTCNPPLESFIVTDTGLLANWNPAGGNVIGFTRDGDFYPYLSWVRADVQSGATTFQECIYDYAGGNCDILDLCQANYSGASNLSADSEVGPPIEQDCTSFTINGEDTIVINGSCNQPPVALCQDVTASADAICEAGADVDNGSFDPEGDPITLSQDPAGPYALGATSPVTLTVEDALGATDSCTATVAVVDDTDPVIACPADVTLECPADTSIGGVNGSATATDNCSVDSIAHTDVVTPTCGTTESTAGTWTATDGSGNTASCVQTVAEQDTTAPLLTVDTTPIEVVDVDCSGDEAVTLPAATATDACDAAPVVANDAPATFPAGETTTVNYTATDACGNESGDSGDVTVAYGANIAVSANKHTVGSGSHPGSTKEPFVGIEVGGYDKSEGSCARVTCGGISHQHYQCIVDSCEPVNTCTTDGNGECTLNLPPGDYVVISDDATKTTLPDPLGVSASDLVCGETKRKHLQQIVKADGKKVPGKTTRRTGSELLIIEPEFVEWSGTEELYPFVFDTVGDWSVTTSVTPPEGFVADNDELSEEVINEVEAVQFVITDIGSEWVPTQVTHEVTHKGRKETIHSEIELRMTPGLARAKNIAINAKGVPITGHPRGHAPGLNR